MVKSIGRAVRRCSFPEVLLRMSGMSDDLSRREFSALCCSAVANAIGDPIYLLFLFF